MCVGLHDAFCIRRRVLSNRWSPLDKISIQYCRARPNSYACFVRSVGFIVNLREIAAINMSIAAAAERLLCFAESLCLYYQRRSTARSSTVVVVLFYCHPSTVNNIIWVLSEKITVNIIWVSSKTLSKKMKQKRDDGRSLQRTYERSRRLESFDAVDTVLCNNNG